MKDGYDSIRVQDITEEANLGRATFYVHYKDKEDLLLATIESARLELLMRFKAETSSSVLPGFRAQFHHAAENRDFYLAILNHVQGSQQIRRVMVKTIQTHLEEIAPVTAIPKALAANYLVGAVLQLLDWWLINDMPYSIDEMETIFLSLIQQGLPDALGIK